jgi:hypothetical protein
MSQAVQEIKKDLKL